MISIITPAYNAEKYIDQMIESVLRQPMETELIIVNDGSSDKTKDICEGYVKINKNIKLINIPNGGAGAARNKGISIAEGEWIIFLDSDDLLLSDKINERLSQYLDQCYQKHIDIICTARCKTDMNLTTQPVITFPEKLEDVVGNIPILEFWTCIYRREFLRENKITFFEFKEQDIETAFRYRAFSKARQVEIKPSYTFYLQRNNLNSNMHTFNPYKLNAIKGRVYYLLTKESIDNRDNKTDIACLQAVMIASLYTYISSLLKDKSRASWGGAEEIDEVVNLFRKRFKIKLKFSRKMWKKMLMYLYRVSYLKVNISLRNFNSIKIDTIKKQEGIEKNVKDERIEDFSIIYQRLEELTKQLCFE